MKKYLLLIVLAFPFLESSGNAIIGLTSVTPGESGVTYTVTTSVNYASWSWQAIGGTVTSSTKTTNSGGQQQAMKAQMAQPLLLGGGGTTYTYTAVVTWGTAGTGVMNFNVNSSVLYSLAVSICPSMAPSPSPSFSYSYGCGSTTVSYTGSIPANTSWYWQTSPSGTLTSYPGNSYTVSSPASLYLRAYISICNVWSVAVATANIAVNPVPTVTASNQAICSGTPTSIVLTNNLPSTTNTWTVASGVQFATNGSAVAGASSPYTCTLAQTLNTVGNNTGTATYTITPSLNGCVGSAINVTVTVNALPGQPSVSTATICNSGVANLTATPGGNGSECIWYDPSGNYMEVSTSISTPTLTQSTTYFAVTLGSNGCLSSPRTPVPVTVNPLPSPPTGISASSVCGAGTTSITATPGANGSLLNLYLSPTATTPYATGLSFSYGITGPTTFYVATLNSQSNCISSMVSVAPVINSIPTVSASGQTICGNTSTNITLTNNLPSTTNTWTVPTNSNGATNGSAVSGASSPYISSLAQPLVNNGNAAAILSYTITPTSNGCAGSPIVVPVTVNPVPLIAATGNNQAICSGQETAITLSTTNNVPNVTYSWSFAEINGVTGQSSNSGTPNTNVNQPIITTTTSPGLAIYLFTATANGCSATLGSGIYVNVNPNPNSPPTPAISSNICGPKTLSYSGTPPSGTSWYWQGPNNPNGQDNYSPIATAATYSAAQNGSISYYLASYNSYGCWNSAGTAVTPNVDIPPTPTPTTTSFTYCEGNIMSMYLSGGVYPNQNWYSTSSTPQLLFSGSTYTPTNLNNGSYTYLVKNLSSNKCESAAGVNVTLQVGGPSSNCENYVNWIENIGYSIDVSGNPVLVGDSKTYSDGFGNSIQVQSKSFQNNQVLASQTIYDRLGNQTLSTLVAPINSSTLGYESRFVLNSSGSIYSATDFDQPIATNLPGEVNNPNPVSNSTIGTLGWYYSSNNTIEPKTASTAFPYVRTYTQPGPNPLTSKSSGIGDAFKMGARVSQADKLLIGSTELSNYYNLRPYFNPNPYYYSSTSLLNITNGAASQYLFTPYQPTTSVISIGNYADVICGQTTGNPGVYPINGTIAVTPGAFCSFQVYGYTSSSTAIAKLQVTDGAGNNLFWGPALPFMASNLVSLDFTVPANITSVKLGIQWTTPVSGAQFYVSSVSLVSKLTSNSPSGSPGYKIISTAPDGKQVASFFDANGNQIASAIVLSTTGTPPNETATYDNSTWSYSFYNDLNQLVASVAPNGVNVGSSAYPSFVTTYRYDQLGRLINTTSPDQGTSQFVYSSDGKIRFSQNQDQTTINAPNNPNSRFSYTNYDNLGRLIESGEYQITGTTPFIFEPPSTTVPNQNSVLNIVDNVGYTGVTGFAGETRCTDVTYIQYDTPAADFVSDANHSQQTYLYGQVSRTSNANATTWYSYDEFGRIAWTKQNITGLGASKTVDYTYDFRGNVLQVAYQIGQSDAFYHHYIYDNDLNLVAVYTSPDGVTKTLQAKYYYYLHGPLKRVELGTNLQGIDYAYNVDGSLKTVNHPDPSLDPGADGLSGINSGFLPDAFGMALDYFTNDYTSPGLITGSFSQSSSNDQFNGLAKAQRWHSQTDNHVMRAYTYNYDSHNRFSSSNFGSVTGSAGNYGFSAAQAAAYQESIGGYDNNGNITALVRNGQTGNSLANYGYSYLPNTNQLSQINNAGAAYSTYQYNSIGQMIKQSQGALTMNLKYNAYGLMKEIRDVNNALTATFSYDDKLQRLGKITYNPDGTTKHNTWYVSDVAGNVLATYESNGTKSPQLTELPIYGEGRIGMYKPEEQTWLYEVTDHLGNVRGVIGNPSPLAWTTTLENATFSTDSVTFQNYHRKNFALFNHTTVGTHAQLLNGGYNGQIGLAKSIQVMPGDVISADVYAKYWNPQPGSPSNLANIATALLNAFGLAAPAQGEINTASAAINARGAFMAGGNDGENNDPKGFLTVLTFDNNYNLVSSNTAYTQLSGSYEQVGGVTNMPFDHLVIAPITITQPGYVYIYVSNENPTLVDIYFDDFTINQKRSPVVAGSDFYPFGLPMENRQITREPYKFGYQGQFSEYDSLTKKNIFQLRLYDPEIGRWLSPDPYGQYNSPYIGMGNNPVGGVDKDGGFFEELFDTFANAAGETRWFETAAEASANGFTTLVAKDLPEVVVTASRSGASSAFYAGGWVTSFDAQLNAWTHTNPQLGLKQTYQNGQWSKPVNTFDVQNAESRGMIDFSTRAAQFVGEDVPATLMLAEGVLSFGTRVTLNISARVASRSAVTATEAFAYSQATFKAFQKQLQEHGMKSILKTQASIQAKLAEHIHKLAAIRKAGGFTSSVEREIRTFQSQLQAIKDLLKP